MPPRAAAAPDISRGRWRHQQRRRHRRCCLTAFEQCSEVGEHKSSIGLFFGSPFSSSQHCTCYIFSSTVSRIRRGNLIRYPTWHFNILLAFFRRYQNINRKAIEVSLFRHSVLLTHSLTIERAKERSRPPHRTSSTWQTSRPPSCSRRRARDIID